MWPMMKATVQITMTCKHMFDVQYVLLLHIIITRLSKQQ